MNPNSPRSRGPKRNPHRKPRASTARSVALDVLLRVENDGAFATAALVSALSRADLSREDRALATELVLGVLRWRRALDGQLAPRCSRPLDRLDPAVLGALRLGAYQLAARSRIPPHAAVNESVALIRARRRVAKASGLVNAVLRALTQDPPRTLDPGEALPEWLMARLERAWGSDLAGELARWSTEVPWTGLRVEPRHLSREALIRTLADEAPRATLEPGRLSPLAVLSRGLGPHDGLPSFRRGWFTVQDQGAQVCTLLLDLGPGQRVLDACAGRGGKTSLLASLALGRATIEAADRHPRKLAQLERDFARLGLTQVRTVAVDLEVGSGDLAPSYDRILVDVPCSGTGTLARRPELRWRLGPETIARLTEVQARILDRSISLLAPGGVLVYCSCSLLPEEGRGQVERALQAHRDRGLRLHRELVLLPHQHQTDGFYAARLCA